MQGQKPDLLKNAGKVINALGPFLGLMFVYMIFYFQAPDSFHSLATTKSVLVQATVIAVSAIGMTLVIITAGIDLSAGSLIALGTVVTALIIKNSGGPEIGFGLPLLAACAGILACAFCGFLNGVMTSVFRIVPFIVTLGMMQIARGVAKMLSGLKQTTEGGWMVGSPSPVNTDRNWLTNMMKDAPLPDEVWYKTPEPMVMDFSKAAVEPNWYSFAPGVVILLVLLVAFFVILRYTTFGRHVFAMGSNEATARLCGINVKRTRILVYTIAGALTGVASVLQYGSLTQGDPTSAIGLELDIIAAVVIGGGSFNGGKGSVVGAVVGAMIIAILRAGCVQVGVENYAQNIIIGAIIIIAVGIDQLKQRRHA